jgi:hypothetical protein
MATWPAGLPAPQKKISITPGDTRVERKLQSGRTEFRRFGAGKPDQAKILIRLLWSQWDTFKHFYERDLNLGTNWFSASWLTILGYNEHKVKFLGYPREVARQGYYIDITCTLLIQKTTWIIGADTEWPCATTGGGAPPVPTWSENAAIYCDANLSAESQSSEWIDGSSIDTWQNQTNEGYDLVTFGDLGPTYRAVGWNGYPVGLEFINDYYGSIRKLKVQQPSVSFVSSDSGWSLAFCLRVHNNSTITTTDNYFTRVIKTDLSIEGNIYFLKQYTCYMRYWYAPTIYSSVFPNFRAASGYNAIHLIELHSDSTELKTYIDGALYTTISSGVKFVSLSDSIIYLGHSTISVKYTVPGLYHMILYHASKCMSEEERIAMRSACSIQYGVPS